MTPAERIVYDKLVADGYTVINKGWPDLLAYKDGEVLAVEVKQGHDIVRPHQEECHRILRHAGMIVKSVYVTEDMFIQDKMRRAYHPTDRETSDAVQSTLEQVFSVRQENNVSIRTETASS
jgi:hypothetical protein